MTTTFPFDPTSPVQPGLPADYPFQQGLDRDTTLRLLSGRFTKADYAAYRTTDHWRAKKGETYGVWGYECLLCGAPGSQVHHTPEGYRRLFREDARRHLRPLCSTCHRRHHQK